MTKNPLTWALAALCFAPGSLSAEVSVSVAAEIRLGNVPPPLPPMIEVVDAPQPKGPPPWAPAHGHRRNHAYYFYPDGHVYYRPADRMWFFLEGDNWKAGVQLPTSLQIDFDRSVSLTMETDRPYIHHTAIVTHYPRDFFTKVKIKSHEKSDKKHEPGKADKEKGSKKEREADSEKKEKPDHTDQGGGHGKGKGKNK